MSYNQQDQLADILRLLFDEFPHPALLEAADRIDALQNDGGNADTAKAASRSETSLPSPIFEQNQTGQEPPTKNPEP